MDVHHTPSPSPSRDLSSNQKALTVGASIHGFKVERSIDAPLTGGTAYLLRHETLGTEVVFNHCPDRNKTFMLDFVTPATSGNGSNHILEHLVLAGSRDYPLKSPFFFTLRGSFKTYQNAHTSAENTAYPFGTTNQQEYRNLMALYLDSALNPLLRETAFRQEGFHFELKKDEATGKEIPAFSGVVYNEMKGGMSDPSTRLYREILAAMYPDTHLGFNTGGDPEIIPEITLEKLREYHRKFYHPSAARIVLHGDIDIEPVLGDLSKRLGEFQYQAPAAELKLQPPFEAPSHRIARYASTDPASPAFQALGWCIGEQRSLTDYFAWEILESVLVGQESSPLKQAIVKSGLCGGLELTGFFGHIKQGMFSVGSAGIAPDKLDAMAELVNTELRRIVRDGLPQEQVEASLNAYEFKLRERHSDEPEGLLLSNLIFKASKMTGDPLSALQSLEHFEELRRRIAEQPSYLESLIERVFIDNPHRARVDLLPDAEWQKKFSERESAAAAARAAALGTEGVAEEERKNVEVKAWIRTKDSPEAAAKVPALGLSDIPREIPVTPELKLSHGQGTVLLQDIPTTGITYANLGFDLSRVPERLLPYAPLFAALLGKVDTGRSDYTSLSQRIGRDTGGITGEVFSQPESTGREERIVLAVSGRARSESAGTLQELIEEIVCETKLNDQKRILEVAKERYEREKIELVESGHIMAMNAALASLHPAYAHRDILAGPKQVRFLGELTKRMVDSWEEVQAELLEFRKAAINNSAVIAMAGEPHTADQREHLARGTLDRLPQASAIPEPAPFVAGPKEEYLSVDSAVNYVVKVGTLDGNWRDYAGPLLAAQRNVTFELAIPKIRVEGHAYSAGAVFHPATGVFGVYSYRDPGIAGTTGVFDAVPEHLRSSAIEEKTLTRDIIGAASQQVAFEMPRDEAQQGMLRFMLGATPEARQLRYTQLLRTTPESLRDLAQFFDGIGDRAVVRALGGAENFTKAGVSFEPVI